MRKITLCFLLLAGLYSFSTGFATVDTFLTNTTYQACFTPQDNCTELVVNTINSAKKSIDVQAYSFTSAPIVKALINAERRGVQVSVLLDKSNVSSRYSVTKTLENNKIPFLIDYKPAIAHNKVMIFDQDTVITGSFNFTKSAQAKNAETLLVINSPALARQYLRNFEFRQQQSVGLATYNADHRKKSRHTAKE